MSPSSRIHRLSRIGLFLALCLLLLPGCGKNKVTKDNFEKITTGMTLAEVETILGGKGTKVEEGDVSNSTMGGGVVNLESGKPAGPPIQKYVWEKGTKKITVHISEGKVNWKKDEGF